MSPVAGLMNEQVVLPDAGRDARRVAGLHVHQIDLIEGIAGLALALKDELLAVVRPVALAGAAALDRQAADRVRGSRAPDGWAVRQQGPAEAGRDRPAASDASEPTNRATAADERLN